MAINPMNIRERSNSVGVCPPPPTDEGVPRLSPAQGDHVFGDIVGVVLGAVEDVRKNGNRDNPTLNNRDAIASFGRRIQDLKVMDLGHHANIENPKTQRKGAAELDMHSHYFGGQADRVRWHIVDIMEKGYTFDRYIRLSRELDRLLDVLVDETALKHYLYKVKECRDADANNTIHNAISVEAARSLIEKAPTSKNKDVVQSIIKRIDHFKWGFLQLIKNYYYFYDVRLKCDTRHF
ncbi:hypothetical protein [Ochrobactrum sp. RH2CCR150]|uniref:hypothetical protein n=1 Tax=Ochrobactrum sp. RH2CCR150 TaxID=2587044 RepID=UPI0015F8CF9B|nr:hypothetical protein [Ochrobactrum sp. RH2CCR150]